MDVCGDFFKATNSRIFSREHILSLPPCLFHLVFSTEEKSTDKIKREKAIVKYPSRHKLEKVFLFPTSHFMPSSQECDDSFLVSPISRTIIPKKISLLLIKNMFLLDLAFHRTIVIVILRTKE